MFRVLFDLVDSINPIRILLIFGLGSVGFFRVRFWYGFSTDLVITNV